jgi:aminoglycoside N3'-acetyltransferase
MLNFSKKKINYKYVIIFSDLMSIMNNNIKFEKTLIEVEKIVKLLIKNKNTIILPTYNLNFPNLKKTSNEETFITTGYLTKFLLKKFSFKRTNKPMYNYAVIGPDEKKILDLKQSTAWGEDSVIRFLSVNKNTIGIGVNTSLYEFFWVTIHSCEEYLKVPYRFFKTFYGIDKITKKKINEKVFVTYKNLNNKKKNLQQKIDLQQKIILKKLETQKKLMIKKDNYIKYNIIYLRDYYVNNFKYIKKILTVKK